MDTISIDLQILLYRVRDRVLEALERNEFRWVETNQETMVKCIIQLHDWFPDTKEKDIRHSIVSALIGKNISSQKEIPAYVTSVLIDITKRPSAYLDEELAAELQDAVESISYGTAGFLPAADPESLAVPSL